MSPDDATKPDPFAVCTEVLAALRVAAGAPEGAEWIAINVKTDALSWFEQPTNSTGWSAAWDATARDATLANAALYEALPTLVPLFRVVGNDP